MLTKSDLQALDQLLDTKLDFKFAQKLKPIIERLTSIEQKVDTNQQLIKENRAMILNLHDWSQEIHEMLVKEKLPQRVHRLEHIVHATA